MFTFRLSNICYNKNMPMVAVSDDEETPVMGSRNYDESSDEWYDSRDLASILKDEFDWAKPEDSKKETTKVTPDIIIPPWTAPEMAPEAHNRSVAKKITRKCYVCGMRNVLAERERTPLCEDCLEQFHRE